MNVKTFYETLAEVYARQTNVRVARVNIAEKTNLATIKETNNSKIKAKCKGA